MRLLQGRVANLGDPKCTNEVTRLLHLSKFNQILAVNHNDKLDEVPKQYMENRFGDWQTVDCDRSTDRTKAHAESTMGVVWLCHRLIDLPGLRHNRRQ